MTMGKHVVFSKDQLVGITELQRNAGAVSARAREKDVLVLKNNTPYIVMLDCERYETLLEKAEQADIYAMLLKRKQNPKWLTTREVFAGLSFPEPEGTVARGKPGKDKPAGAGRPKASRRSVR